jgi:phospholipase/carboxylesterase
MFLRTVTGAVIVLSLMPLAAPAQQPSDSISVSPPAATELFWQRTATLVPIRMILPPGFTAQEPHTLIVALHGYGSSAERFRRVGERLAEAGLMVALPEATYAFMREDGELGFDWGLYHTGDSALDRRAFELLITESMSDVVRAVQERYAVERTYVLGFSQGAIAAVLSGIYLNDALDGVITFGLGAYDPQWFADPTLASSLAAARHLSVLLIHGDEDERVPVAVSEGAREHLAGEGYEVTLHRFHGGHSVPDKELDFVIQWLGEKQP